MLRAKCRTSAVQTLATATSFVSATMRFATPCQRSAVLQKKAKSVVDKVQYFDFVYSIYRIYFSLQEFQALEMIASTVKRDFRATSITSANLLKDRRRAALSVLAKFAVLSLKILGPIVTKVWNVPQPTMIRLENVCQSMALDWVKVAVLNVATDFIAMERRASALKRQRILAMR